MAWQGGSKADGSDSLAVEVAPREHWPDLQALICVVSDAKKGTPSTAGMQRTVATSPLLQHRIKEVVPQRMRDISKAIQDKDFDTFAAITMADSNNFHATCLDTTPPIFYMNDVSRSIVQLIEELNRASEQDGKGKIAAYTYDAGPNAVLYAPKENVPLVLQLIRHYYPNADFDDTVSFGDRKQYGCITNSHPSCHVVQPPGVRPECISPRRTATRRLASRLALDLQRGRRSRPRSRRCSTIDPHSSWTWTDRAQPERGTLE